MKILCIKKVTDSVAGVASFEYNPRDVHFKQGSLFDMLSRPLDDLKEMLLREYGGRTIRFNQLYEEHSVDKPYIKKNYKDVLKILLGNGDIKAINPKTSKPPRKGSFSDHIQITFGG